MATRTLKIMHVAKTKDECQELVDKTTEALKALHQGIAVTPSEIRVTRFPDYRCDIHISKVNGVAWHSYYKAINSVKAVPYDFI